MDIRKALLLAVVFLHAAALHATDTIQQKKEPRLKSSIQTSLNVSQSAYSNWSAGGENSIAGVARFGIDLKYAKNKMSWDTSFASAYGLMFQDSERRKTDDRIELASKFGYKASKRWSYTTLAQVKTQYDKGYAKYPVKDKHKYTSDFFAPAYITVSLGMDYKPDSDLSAYISPVSMRFTIVNDDSLSNVGAYGVEKGERIRSEYGAFAKVTYSKKIDDRVLLKTKLELFSNLAYNPQNIDVNIEASIDFKVTKWLTTNIHAQLVYDDKASVSETKGPVVQLKEVMGMGISYTF